jgi:hypothetical protein
MPARALPFLTSQNPFQFLYQPAFPKLIQCDLPENLKLILRQRQRRRIKNFLDPTIDKLHDQF